MDGHALQDIMVPLNYSDSLKPARVIGDDRDLAFSEKDEKHVMDNLRRLGYT